MRRYTRLSHGFSRKLAKSRGCHGPKLFRLQFHQNLYHTQRMSPAMAAGVTDRQWSVEDLVTFWGAYEQRKAA